MNLHGDQVTMEKNLMLMVLNTTFLGMHLDPSMD